MSELYRNIDLPCFAKRAPFGLIVCHLLKKTDVTLVSALLEIVSRCFIFDALRDLVPLVQFQKHEKNPWESFVNSCKCLMSC